MLCASAWLLYRGGRDAGYVSACPPFIIVFPRHPEARRCPPCAAALLGCLASVPECVEAFPWVYYGDN